MTRPRKSPPIMIAALLLLGQVGCATVRPSEEIRANLGTIGVASAPRGPLAPLGTPFKGSASSGAAKGALSGVGATFAVALQTGGYGILLAPVLIVGGAIHGGVTALPADVVEKAETALKSALGDVNIQAPVRDHVFELTPARTGRPVVLVSGTCTRSWGRGDCSSLEGQGTETLLEIREIRGLVSAGFANPNFRLVTTVLAELIRVKDGTVLFGRQFSYRGATHSFLEWAENDAERFRQELSQGAKALASEIVDELFCAGSSSACKEATPERFDEPEEKAGQVPGD